MNKQDGKIYLSVVRAGDNFVVVDQDGRPVQGVRSVSVSAGHDFATEATITFYDASLKTDQIAHINGRFS